MPYCPENQAAFRHLLELLPSFSNNQYICQRDNTPLSQYTSPIGAASEDEGSDLGGFLEESSNGEGEASDADGDFLGDKDTADASSSEGEVNPDPLLSSFSMP